MCFWYGSHQRMTIGRNSMSKLISKDDFIKLFDNYDITISDSDYSRFEAYADQL